ncbi:MAG: hypothetical protein KatS3mg045_0373 [Bellilinea sp.]|nr:MAG: hypothetical protein KatS3mg045_0373 [Bellilinea sp.]
MRIPILPSPIRRNHALEHATLQILAKSNPRLRLAGYSDSLGFWIIGRVDFDDLQEAIHQAETRLNRGEAHLAIHPNCGTNFAASGLIAALAAFVGMLGSGNSARRRWERLPLVAVLVTLSLILSRPLGPWLQAVATTDARLNGLHVVGIDRFERRGIPLYRVHTRS